MEMILTWPFAGSVVLRRELVADLDGAVPRAVLGEDDLVAPAERLEALAQVDDGGVEDRLLVVDGDDDRDVRIRVSGAGHGSGSFHGCHGRPPTRNRAIPGGHQRARFDDVVLDGAVRPAAVAPDRPDAVALAEHAARRAMLGQRGLRDVDVGRVEHDRVLRHEALAGRRPPRARGRRSTRSRIARHVDGRRPSGSRSRRRGSSGRCRRCCRTSRRGRRPCRATGSRSSARPLALAVEARG